MQMPPNTSAFDQRNRHSDRVHPEMTLFGPADKTEALRVLRLDLQNAAGSDPEKLRISEMGTPPRRFRRVVGHKLKQALSGGQRQIEQPGRIHAGGHHHQHQGEGQQFQRGRHGK